MKRRTAALLWLGPVLILAALITASALVLGVLATGVLLIVGAAPAYTVFAFLYLTTVRWWTFWIGRALAVSSTATAMLLDIALLYHWLGDNYALRYVVLLTVYTFIFCGGWLKLFALVHEKGWLRRRGRRP